jgi:long-chain acyl-CoA synthetase
MDKLRTLQSLVETLSEHSDQAVMLALHKEGVERWSYAELADHVQRLAHGLAAAGVGCGDHVALLADNRPAWIIACLAVLKAGAVVVPVDVQFGSQVLDHILHDSGARAIFTTAEASKRLEGLNTEVPMRPIILDVEADDERSWRRLLTDRAGELPHVKPEALAALFYTSGTTGPPKGVPLTHGHLVFQLGPKPTLVSPAANSQGL